MITSILADTSQGVLQACNTEVTETSGTRPATAGAAEESGSEKASDGGVGSDNGEEISSDGVFGSDCGEEISSDGGFGSDCGEEIGTCVFVIFLQLNRITQQGSNTRKKRRSSTPALIPNNPFSLLDVAYLCFNYRSGGREQGD